MFNKIRTSANRQARYFVTKIYNWMSSVIEYKDEARICPSFLEHRPQSKALKAYLSLQSKICFAQRRPWNQCSRLLMTSIEITAQGHQWWSHKHWWQYISASLRGFRKKSTSYIIQSYFEVRITLLFKWENKIKPSSFVNFFWMGMFGIFEIQQKKGTQK